MANGVQNNNMPSSVSDANQTALVRSSPKAPSNNTEMSKPADSQYLMKASGLKPKNNHKVIASLFEQASALYADLYKQSDFLRIYGDSGEVGSYRYHVYKEGTRDQILNELQPKTTAEQQATLNNVSVDDENRYEALRVFAGMVGVKSYSIYKHAQQLKQSIHKYSKEAYLGAVEFKNRADLDNIFRENLKGVNAANLNQDEKDASHDLIHVIREVNTSQIKRFAEMQLTLQANLDVFRYVNNFHNLLSDYAHKFPSSLTLAATFKMLMQGSPLGVYNSLSKDPHGLKTLLSSVKEDALSFNAILNLTSFSGKRQLTAHLFSDAFIQNRLNSDFKIYELLEIFDVEKVSKLKLEGLKGIDNLSQISSGFIEIKKIYNKLKSDKCLDLQSTENKFLGLILYSYCYDKKFDATLSGLIDVKNKYPECYNKIIDIIKDFPRELYNLKFRGNTFMSLPEMKAYAFDKDNKSLEKPAYMDLIPSYNVVVNNLRDTFWAKELKGLSNQNLTLDDIKNKAASLQQRSDEFLKPFMSFSEELFASPKSLDFMLDKLNTGIQFYVKELVTRQPRFAEHDSVRELQRLFDDHKTCTDGFARKLIAKDILDKFMNDFLKPDLGFKTNPLWRRDLYNYMCNSLNLFRDITDNQVPSPEFAEAFKPKMFDESLRTLGLNDPEQKLTYDEQLKGVMADYAQEIIDSKNNLNDISQSKIEEIQEADVDVIASATPETATEVIDHGKESQSVHESETLATEVKKQLLNQPDEQVKTSESLDSSRATDRSRSKPLLSKLRRKQSVKAHVEQPNVSAVHNSVHSNPELNQKAVDDTHQGNTETLASSSTDNAKSEKKNQNVSQESSKKQELSDDSSEDGDATKSSLSHNESHLASSNTKDNTLSMIIEDDEPENANETAVPKKYAFVEDASDDEGNHVVSQRLSVQGSELLIPLQETESSSTIDDVPTAASIQNQSSIHRQSQAQEQAFPQPRMEAPAFQRSFSLNALHGQSIDWKVISKTFVSLQRRVQDYVDQWRSGVHQVLSSFSDATKEPSSLAGDASVKPEPRGLLTRVTTYAGQLPLLSRFIQRDQQVSYVSMRSESEYSRDNESLRLQSLDDHHSSSDKKGWMRQLFDFLQGLPASLKFSMPSFNDAFDFNKPEFRYSSVSPSHSEIFDTVPADHDQSDIGNIETNSQVKDQLQAVTQDFSKDKVEERSEQRAAGDSPKTIAMPESIHEAQVVVDEYKELQKVLNEMRNAIFYN